MSSSAEEVTPPPTHHGKEPGTTHSHREISKAPENPNYYEKDGLRTYGDDVDHDHEPKLTARRFMSFVAMAFLWTGSQIPVYLYGTVLLPPIDLLPYQLTELRRYSSNYL